MREIVDALLALEPTTMESRPSWFALQEEFTSVSARLNALHAPEPLEPECELEPHCELEQVCRWCCKPYDAHLSERAPGAPQPRMPCLGLKSSYLARDCAQHAPPRSVEPEERCIACALTDGGVCPDHAAERSS
jgi:hypothetical protein